MYTKVWIQNIDLLLLVVVNSLKGISFPTSNLYINGTHNGPMLPKLF